MKRDQCNMSTQDLTLNDARVIEQFRIEVALVAKLKQEGHAHSCATNRVFGEATECICEIFAAGEMKP